MLFEEEVPMVHRRKGLMVEEAPCPPVVSRAKGEKTDPVAAQMASYLERGASYLVCLERKALFFRNQSKGKELEKLEPLYCNFVVFFFPELRRARERCRALRRLHPAPRRAARARSGRCLLPK